jgi:hypothetical protein
MPALFREAVSLVAKARARPPAWISALKTGAATGRASEAIPGRYVHDGARWFDSRSRRHAAPDA